VLVRRLRARRDELVDAIFARVRGDAFDRAGEQDAEYLAGLHAAVAAALEYVLTGIELGEEGVGQVPTVALEQARRAARVGVGLDTVLRRYVVGLAILEDSMMREAEQEEDWVPRIGSRGLGPADWIPPTPSALREVLARMSALVDRLITAVSRAYGEEIEGAGHAPSPPRASPGRAVGPRRDRILEAMVEMAAERGFEHVTVRLVAERAGVSTRTFYEEFGDLQECFITVLDLGLEHTGVLIAQAFAGEERWQDGVLGALASLLVFLDAEPLLARVWFVESAAAGSWAMQRREEIVEALRSGMVEYWTARGEQAPEPVAAAGVMASVLGLIQTHLVTERPEPLIELLGPMMGLVTSLYLDTQDRAREVQRGAELVREIRAGRSSIDPPGVPRAASMGVAVPTALRDPRAHRMRVCLLYVAKHPGASNQEVGEGVGVAHSGHAARLLSRLAALGLLVKRAGGPGRSNEWSATTAGEQVALALAGEDDRADRAR
jgi:AcrR family transcriptional regulator